MLILGKLVKINEWLDFPRSSDNSLPEKKGIYVEISPTGFGKMGHVLGHVMRAQTLCSKTMPCCKHTENCSKTVPCCRVQLNAQKTAPRLCHAVRVECNNYIHRSMGQLAWSCATGVRWNLHRHEIKIMAQFCCLLAVACCMHAKLWTSTAHVILDTSSCMPKLFVITQRCFHVAILAVANYTVCVLW